MIKKKLDLITKGKYNTNWRDITNNNNYNDLNHLYLKLSFFLSNESIINNKIEKELNWKFINNIIIGQYLSRIATKDINVNINEKISKNDLYNFVISYYEKIDKNILNEYEKESIKKYFYNTKSLEKEIFSLISIIINEYEFNRINEENKFIPNIKKSLINNNFQKWKEQLFNKNEKYREIYNNLSINNENKLEELNFLYLNNIQERYNGFRFLGEKTKLGEHQILTYLTYFQIFNKEIENMNNLELKYNLINILYHDTIESLTKDINSPLKNEINGFRKVLETLEKELFDILPFEKDFFNELNKINILEPFKNKKISSKIRINGKNQKIADDLSALIEVYHEIVYYNNNSPDVIEAFNSIKDKYLKNKNYSEKIKNLFREFNINNNQNIRLNLN